MKDEHDKLIIVTNDSKVPFDYRSSASIVLWESPMMRLHL